MIVPFLDLKAQYQSIKKEIYEIIEKVCGDVAFSNGVYVENFEESFAKYC
ncbi:uncharacterized protein METZ01_LOCUS486671, partial [marine metagenome]